MLLQLIRGVIRVHYKSCAINMTRAELMSSKAHVYLLTSLRKCDVRLETSRSENRRNGNMCKHLTSACNAHIECMTASRHNRLSSVAKTYDNTVQNHQKLLHRAYPSVKSHSEVPSKKTLAARHDFNNLVVRFFQDGVSNSQGLTKSNKKFSQTSVEVVQRVTRCATM